MMLIIQLISAIFIGKVSCLGLEIADGMSKESFGPYDINWKNATICVGPKLRNLTKCTGKFIANGKPVKFSGDIEFFEQTTIEDLKISIYKIKDGVKKFLYTYRLNRPCQHFSIGPAISMFFNSTNCVVKKGHYHFEMNLTTLTKELFGASFFYGEYYSKSLLQSKRGNISCYVTHLIVEKV